MKINKELPQHVQEILDTKLVDIFLIPCDLDLITTRYELLGYVTFLRPKDHVPPDVRNKLKIARAELEQLDSAAVQYDTPEFYMVAVCRATNLLIGMLESSRKFADPKAAYLGVLLSLQGFLRKVERRGGNVVGNRGGILVGSILISAYNAYLEKFVPSVNSFQLSSTKESTAFYEKIGMRDIGMGDFAANIGEVDPLRGKAFATNKDKLATLCQTYVRRRQAAKGYGLGKNYPDLSSEELSTVSKLITLARRF